MNTNIDNNQENPPGDQYDAAVAYFRAHPERLFGAWDLPYHFDNENEETRATLLFGKCSNFGGCLLQVKAGHSCELSPSLVAGIRADERIPTSGYLCSMPEGQASEVLLDKLDVIVEWRRRIAKEQIKE